MEFQNNKISELIEGQLPNFLQEEGPKFIQFVENYYQWMETSKLEVSVVGGSLNVQDIPQPLRIRGYDSEKIVKDVYANVKNIYELDNGNYVFYINEYSTDPNKPNTRGFSTGNSVVFLDTNDQDEDIVFGDVTMEVVSYIQNVSISSKNLWNLQDIDRTLDEYVDFFMKEYLKGFPLSFPTKEDSLDIDTDDFKKFLVKHSREFYQSKGTEDSFKYFFRSIFNVEIDVIYPKERIMKASNSSFDSISYMYLRPIDSENVPNILNRKIIGENSLSECFVESTNIEKKGKYIVLKVELNKSSITGDFSLNENILDDTGQIIGSVYYCGSSVEVLPSQESFKLNDRLFVTRDGRVLSHQDLAATERGSTLELVISSINTGEITKINVTSGGSGHSLGEKLTFNNDGCFSDEIYQRPVLAYVSKIDSNGSITEIEVNRIGRGYTSLPKITHIGQKEVDTEIFELVSSNVGTIQEIFIKNPGLDYNYSQLSLDLNSSGTDDIKIIFNSIFNDGGNFLDRESFLSNVKVMQDSRYYQNFSYVIDSSIQLFKFKDLLKSLIHPAGMEMFGTITSEDLGNCEMVSSQSLMKIPIILKKNIGYYSDIVLNEFENNMVSRINFSLGEGGTLDSSYEDVFDGGTSISDVADYHINSVSSWDNVFQIYKHKYTNLVTGINKTNNFKFNKIDGIKVSINQDQKTADFFRTIFLDVVKQDERDFVDTDFSFGEVICQGTEQNKTLDSTVQGWDAQDGILEILVLSGTIDDSLQFYKSTNYTNITNFEIDKIVENFEVVGHDLNIGDFIYIGSSVTNPDSLSSITNIDSDKLYLNTTIGQFEQGDSIESIRQYDLTNVFSSVVLSQNSDEESTPNLIPFISNNFSVDDLIYQYNQDDNEVFRGKVLSWDVSSKELEIEFESGLIDTNLPIKRVSTNHNNVSGKQHVLTLENKEEPFDYNQFIVNDTFDQGVVQGTVYKWDRTKGVLDSYPTTGGDFVLNQDVSITKNSVTKNFNVNRIRKGFIVQGVQNDFFNQKFQFGDEVFQGDNLDTSLRTARAEVVSWDSFTGELIVSMIGGTFDIQQDIKIQTGLTFENYNITVIFDRLYLDRNKIEFTSSDFVDSESVYQFNNAFEGEVDDWDETTGQLKVNHTSGVFNPNIQILRSVDFIPTQDNGYDIETCVDLLIVDDTNSLDYNVGERVYQGNSVNDSTALGEVEHWDSIDKKIKINKISGNFEISQLVKKEYDSYNINTVEEVLEVSPTEIGDFNTSNKLYQKDGFENTYIISKIQNDKIYVNYDSNTKIDSTLKIMKEHDSFTIGSVTQESLFLNLQQQVGDTTLSDYIQNNQNIFIDNETITQPLDLNRTATSRVLQFIASTGEIKLKTEHNSESFSSSTLITNNKEYLNFYISDSQVSTTEIKFGDTISLKNNDNNLFDELFNVINVDKINDQFTTNVRSGKDFQLVDVFRRESQDD